MTDLGGPLGRRGGARAGGPRGGGQGLRTGSAKGSRRFTRGSKEIPLTPVGVLVPDLATGR